MSHWREYRMVYALLALFVAGIVALIVLTQHWTDSRAQECGRAGRVELSWEYDYDGNPTAVWCLNSTGDPVDVPEWS